MTVANSPPQTAGDPRSAPARSVAPRRVLIAGASGYGKTVADLFAAAGHRVLGFLDPDRPAGSEWFELPVAGREDDLPRLADELGVDAVALGMGDVATRARVVARIGDLAPHVPVIGAIHPGAHVARGTVIEPSSQVMAAAVVSPGSTVGAHVQITPGVTLGHDVAVGAFAMLAPNAAIGGGARIGASAVIGIGATVVHGVAVGDHTVVGAGAVVVRDLPAGVVAYGNPARPVRHREPGEGYL